jgi:hypothetical protein
MPVDPYIARGVAPIDPSNTLMQIAALKQRDRSLASDEQQNALMRDRYQQSQQQYTQQQDQERQKQEGMQALAKIEWAMRSQSPKAALLSDPQAMQAFSAQGVDLNTLDDNGARELLGRAQGAIAAQLGIRPPEPKQPYGVNFQPGPFGSQIATDGQRFQIIEPPKPQGGGESKPQLVEVPLGDGTTQKQWIRPGESAGAAVGAPTSAQALSPKDTNTAKVKLTQVKVARNQLNEAKRRYAALKDSFSAGPGGQFIPTPAGKAFDAAVDSMRGSITALTRVPGVGAMSDYETRLDQSKFPSRGNYEQVGEQQLQALEQLLNTIEAGYSELLGGKQAPSQEAPTRRKFNPQTGKIE